MSTSDLKVFLDMPCSDGRFLMGARVNGGCHDRIFSATCREDKTLLIVDGDSWSVDKDFRNVEVNKILDLIASEIDARDQVLKLQKESAS